MELSKLQIVLIAVVAATLLFLVVSGIVYWWRNWWRNKEKNRQVQDEKQDLDGNTISYYRLHGLAYKKPSMKTFETFVSAFKLAGKNLVQARTYDDSMLVQFDSLNAIDDYMTYLKPSKDMTHVYGILGTDYMASKSALAYNLRNAGFEDILPKTYITSLEEDLLALQRDLSASKQAIPYILKKNVQRQVGQEISNDPQYILKNANAKDFVVVQEMLQNPLIINGHKCNMRVYLLVVIRPDGKDSTFAIYNNGFMYYTPKDFKLNSIEKEEVITTGYIDRSIYEKNPLTHKDLQAFLGIDKYAVLQNNIINLARKVKNTYDKVFLEKNKHIPGIKFLIYGMDIAPDNKLSVTLMEINKGPDLSYKDKRDAEVKLHMVYNAMGLAGLFGDSWMPKAGSDEFIQL